MMSWQPGKDWQPDFQRLERDTQWSGRRWSDAWHILTSSELWAEDELPKVWQAVVNISFFTGPDNWALTFNHLAEKYR